MPDVSYLDSSVAICSQLSPRDLASMAARGFHTLINNRPDREAWLGQPTHEALATAADAAGMTSHFLPITLQTLQADDVRRFHQIVEHANGPVLATCASGFRCALLWGMSRIAFAGGDPSSVLTATAAAGQPLEQHLPLIDRLVGELGR